MKSVRILILASVSLLIGYGLIVTLNAWGQEPIQQEPIQVEPGVKTPENPFLADVVRHGADPEMDKLMQAEAAAEQQVAKLIESYAHTEGEAKRSGIKSDLSKVLEKEFDAQQKRRDLELKRVEERLKKVRDLMEKRDRARRSIIDNRLDQLIREADGLGWTPPAGINLHQPSLGNFAQPRGLQK
jgi:hypothetical protein